MSKHLASTFIPNIPFQWNVPVKNASPPKNNHSLLLITNSWYYRYSCNSNTSPCLDITSPGHTPTMKPLPPFSLTIKSILGWHKVPATLAILVVAEGVDFYICGQSAAFRGVTRDNILPGIKFSHSAMSAHAILQKEGYAIIPW